jgi:hypothetical protein
LWRTMAMEMEHTWYALTASQMPVTYSNSTVLEVL